MADKVTSSTRLWSDEVARARADKEIDAIGPGEHGIATMLKPKRADYTFSNGREFEQKGYQ